MKMETTDSSFHWFPRTICILGILFISLFSFDVFTPDLTLWQQLGAFFIHNIPSIVLLLALIVAWKWELIGGIIFTLIGLGTAPLIFLHNYRNINNHSVSTSLAVVLLINFPFVVVGILFIVSHYMNKKNRLKAQIKE
jgi:hypothetical protein